MSKGTFVFPASLPERHERTSQPIVTTSQDKWTVSGPVSTKDKEMPVFEHGDFEDVRCEDHNSSVT